MDFTKYVELGGDGILLVGGGDNAAAGEGKRIVRRQPSVPVERKSLQLPKYPKFTVIASIETATIYFLK